MAAIRAGYLNKDLTFTQKQVVRPPRKSVKGFQQDLIWSKDDIRSEVDYFCGPAAQKTLEVLGIKNNPPERLLSILVGDEVTPPPTNESLLSPESIGRLIQLPRSAIVAYLVAAVIEGGRSSRDRIEEITGFDRKTVNRGLRLLQDEHVMVCVAGKVTIPT